MNHSPGVRMSAPLIEHILARTDLPLGLPWRSSTMIDGPPGLPT
jgi:hypothetical protein